jgi:hypothetical protein
LSAIKYLSRLSLAKPAKLNFFKTPASGLDRRLAQLSWRRDEGCPSGGIEVMEAAKDIPYHPACQEMLTRMCRKLSASSAWILLNHKYATTQSQQATHAVSLVGALRSTEGPQKFASKKSI